jgi:periplasmic copper chaperone A
LKFLLALLILLPFGAAAHDYKVGDLEIIHPSISAPPPSAKSAAAYVVISNEGTEADRLIGVEVAGVGMAMLHASVTDADGLTSMEHLDGVDLPPGAIVALEPGAMHIMLTGLTARFVDGETVKGALIFERAGRFEMEFMVDPPGGSDHVDHSGHGG